MLVSRISEIVRTRGHAEAAKVARAAMMGSKIIRLLETREFDPNYTPAARSEPQPNVKIVTVDSPKLMKKPLPRIGKTERKREARRNGSVGVNPTNVGNPRAKGPTGGGGKKK